MHWMHIVQGQEIWQEQKSDGYIDVVKRNTFRPQQDLKQDFLFDTTDDKRG